MNIRKALFHGKKCARIKQNHHSIWMNTNKKGSRLNAGFLLKLKRARDGVSLGMMTVKEVLSELTDKLNIHGISIFCGNDMECIYSTGHYKNNVIEAAYVNDDKFLNHFDEYGVNMVNNIASLTIEFPEVFRKLRDNNICSLLQMKADGADGKEYMVEFDIFGTNRRKWSDTDVIMLRMVVLGVVNAISGQLTD